MDSAKKVLNLDSFSELNIVDFYTVPHYNDIPFSKVTKVIEAQYKKQLNFINNFFSTSVTFQVQQIIVLQFKKV